MRTELFKKLLEFLRFSRFWSTLMRFYCKPELETTGLAPRSIEPSSMPLPDEKKAYYQWLKDHAPPIEAFRKKIETMANPPFFSIILPTYNSNLTFFKTLVHFISLQAYPQFEVCISDDASTDTGIIEFLKQLADSDARFRVSFANENGGIAMNTNRAMKMAKGDFLVLCDHDDLIEPHALLCLAAYIADHPETDLLYSDEDMMDKSGFRHSPRLQPDWNPDMLTSHMYCPHIVSVRQTLARTVGFEDPALDGAQDYDFFLKTSEKARHVGHVPYILYTWRSAPGSVAMDASEKIYAYEAGRQALENAMCRRSVDAVVLKVNNTNLGVYRIKRKLHQPRVSHIIEGRTPEILRALRSIHDIANLPVEIIVVIEEHQTDLIAQAKNLSGIRVVNAPNNSGRAQMYNLGATAASHPFLIFSGDKVEILDCEYPGAALEQTMRPEIGAVGFKLMYPNGLYYHTGMILGVNGICGYAHRNLPQTPGHWNFAACIRNYSAVSWDLLSVAKEKWEAIAGFDETLHFYGDVDFCLKLMAQGWRNIYTPYVSGVIKRSVHRLDELRSEFEAAILMERYGAIISEDPHYHPFLSKHLEDFSISMEK